MADILNVIMRWVHISSMATLIGGMLYARLAMAPAAGALAEDARDALGDGAAARYRPLVLAAIIGLIVSGVYRYVTTPGHRTVYEILFGIKMLLVAHVFGVAVVIVKPHNARRTRQMTGIVISGLLIIAISAWLSRTY